MRTLMDDLLEIACDFDHGGQAGKISSRWRKERRSMMAAAGDKGASVL